MIAFYRQTDESTSTMAVRRARRLAASSLLSQESPPARSTPPVAAWKAWLFAAWVVVVTGVYFAHMFVAVSRLRWQ